VTLPSYVVLLLASTLAVITAAYLIHRRSAFGAWHREVEHSRARFLAEAQQIAHIGSWEVDLVTNRTAWSDENYRIMGLVPQAEPATFELFLRHVHPDDLERVMRSVGEARAGGSFEFGFRLIRVDGTVRHVLNRGQTTRRDGVAVRLIGTAQDLTDQKAAERALELAHVQQKALLDNLPDLVFLKDRESRFVAVNEPLARVCGVLAGDMIGKTDFDFFPSDQALRYAADDRSALARGERMVVEERVAGAAGAECWMETTTSPYRDATGEIGGIVGITRDVTVRHEAAERLSENALHYQLLFDRNPLPMWVFDADTLRFLAVNEAAIAHYGYDREQFLTMTIEDIRPQEHRASLANALSQGHASNSCAGSFVHLTRDGRRIETEVIADSIVMNGREAWLVLSRDVTSERSSVRALQASEERYRMLFVESLAGNYVSTVDGRLLACNPTFARMMGHDDPAEACAHATTEYYSDQSRRLRFLSLVRKQKRIVLHEDELVRRDGSVLQILENVIGHFDESGELTEIHGFVIDVTDRKQLEEQLRHSQKLQAVGQLAGGIAHDFNNLLTAMKLHGEFVLDEMAENDPHRADILEMQLAADRATMLTKQLLAFGRKQLLNPKVINANVVIEGMTPMVRRLIGEDVTVTIVLDPAAGSVMADQGQIEQVILNLAVNARDAMSHGGTFTVATGIVVLDHTRAGSADLPPGAYISLTASDTGCGMSASVLAHIFEPFFTTKEQGKGTGLGLATVYGIVKQSGGHIWVSSVPDVGTSFEILLPRVNEAPAGIVVAPSAAPRGTETILVVEDDLPIQALTRRLLERQGYSVIVANNGEEALLRVAQHIGEIALVLTDVVMPSLSGGELAACLANTNPDLAVLFMSGYANDVIVLRGLLDASAAILQKPFTATSLAVAVRSALDAETLAPIL
jgi:two-component system, cell cycle sensor histidine kinase and response regulator CckA